MRPNTNLAVSQTMPVTDYRKPAGSTSGRSSVFPIRRSEPTTPKVRLQEVSLSYRSEDGSELLALDRIEPKRATGRVSLHRRPFGLRQVDFVAPDRGTAKTDLRLDCN